MKFETEVHKLVENYQKFISANTHAYMSAHFVTCMHNITCCECVCMDIYKFFCCSSLLSYKFKFQIS